jgi:cell division protein FtsL
VISRNGFLVLVLLADIASALGVVYVRGESRALASELGALEDTHDRAMTTWSRLQLEQSMLADAGEVEGKARRMLDMRSPETLNILEIPR